MKLKVLGSLSVVAALFFGQGLFHNAFAKKSNRSTFDGLLLRALDESPAVKAAQARKDLSDFSVSQKSLFWTPTVMGSLSQEVSGSRGEQSGVQFDLNLFRFGSDVAALRAARAESRARNLESKGQDLELEKNFSELLFQYLLIQSETAYQVRLVAIKEQTVKMAQERFRRGQLPDQEVLRARLDRDQSEASLLDRKLQLKKAEDQIRMSIGDVNLNELSWPWLDFVDNPKALSGLKQKNSQIENIEILLLQEQQLAQKQKYWSSKLGYLPSLNLSSSWINDRMNGTGQSGWSSALTLTIPLWDKMASYAQARSHLVESQILEEQLQFSRRSFSVQQESLSERLELSRKSAEKAVAGAASVKKLFEDSLRRFQAGRSSLNDLFLDESRYLQSETAAQQALASYHRQMIEACHSQNESVLNCF